MKNQFFETTYDASNEVMTAKFLSTCQKIDAKNFEEIQKKATELLNGDECVDIADFVFDLDNVIYVSSAGLRMFSSINKVAQDLNVNYKLINLRRDILKMFQLTGYASIFEIEEKVEFK